MNFKDLLIFRIVFGHTNGRTDLYVEIVIQMCSIFVDWPLLLFTKQGRHQDFNQRVSLTDLVHGKIVFVGIFAMIFQSFGLKSTGAKTHVLKIHGCHGTRGTRSNDAPEGSVILKCVYRRRNWTQRLEVGNSDLDQKLHKKLI